MKSGIVRWESKWSDVGREVRLSHSFKLSEVSLERLPILWGNDSRLKHLHKKSEVRLDRFPIFSDTFLRFLQSIKLSEVSLVRFPILDGNNTSLEQSTQTEFSKFFQIFNP